MGIAAFNFVLLGLFIGTQLSNDLPRRIGKITIETRVLGIPAFQSKMAGGGVLEDGRVWGVVIGGNVTRNFPEGITILEAPSNRKDQEYVRLIKDKVAAYPCSCGDFIQINTWRRYIVTLDSGADGHKITEIHEKINGRGEYWLHFAINTVETEVFLNFLCEAIFYDSLKFDERGRILREELYNWTIPLILDQTILIGFAPPKDKNGDRGSAYWFVISTSLKRFTDTNPTSSRTKP